DDEVGSEKDGPGEGLVAVDGLDDVVPPPLQDLAERTPDPGSIIDHEDFLRTLDRHPLPPSCLPTAAGFILPHRQTFRVFLREVNPARVRGRQGAPEAS